MKPAPCQWTHASHKLQHYFTDPLALLCLRITETCTSHRTTNTHTHTQIRIHEPKPSTYSCNICTLLTSAILIAFKFNFLLPHFQPHRTNYDEIGKAHIYVCVYMCGAGGAFVYFLNFVGHPIRRNPRLAPSGTPFNTFPHSTQAMLALLAGRMKNHFTTCAVFVVTIFV